MIKLDKIAKNKHIILMPLENKYITKEFVRCLNKKSVNKYLEIRKRKQTVKMATEYLNYMIKNKYPYYGIFSSFNKKLIGTITLRDYKKGAAYIGYMICYEKYFGSIESKTSFPLFISLVFKNTSIKKIYAGTIKENISSNFNLIRNNFKIIEKNKITFKFLLKKTLKR